MSPLTATRSILIQAPLEAVWQVHTDVNAWSQWQHAISSAQMSGSLAVGASFLWKSGGLSITSTVETLEPPRGIAWSGTSLGTRAHHTWIMHPQDGGTLVTTEESMSGWLVALLKLLAPRSIDQSLDRWLRALKARSEEAAAGQAG